MRACVLEIDYEFCRGVHDTSMQRWDYSSKLIFIFHYVLYEYVLLTNINIYGLPLILLSLLIKASLLKYLPKYLIRTAEKIY